MAGGRVVASGSRPVDARLRTSDFGLSTVNYHARPDGLLHTAYGTPTYVVPKMRQGDFSCPTWLTTDARKLIKMLFDLNPDTCITFAGLHKMQWFRKMAYVQ
ncbi:putative CBL-interacting protein kinase 27 [Oryza sativa Japonica Group]|uniref:putative CBL-interacting protein kinase 27 n=1 Tax=Oryza sativa subsp. japonica TaxID=39947 RepID=UPI00339D0187